MLGVLTAVITAGNEATAAPALVTSSGRTVTAAGDGLRFGEPEFLTPLKKRGVEDTAPPSVSGDGSVIAFASERSDLITPDQPGTDVFYDVDGARAHPYRYEAMQGPRGRLYYASCAHVSRDGRFIVFCSDSPKLVPGDTNGQFDIFVYDRVTRRTDRVNVSSTGAQTDEWSRTAAISADGRYVAFTSYAPLVPGDTNGATDVFVRDRTLGTTERVSVNSAGRQGNGDSGYGSSTVLAISGDGRYVGFSSDANNLAPDDTNKAQDAFLRDRTLGITERVTVNDDGQQMSWNPVYKRATVAGATSVSDDGRYVAFVTDGTDIGGLPADTDHNPDQFLRDRTTGRTILVSQRGGQPAGINPGFANGGQLTPDGRLMTFTSNSAVLSPFSTTLVIYTYELGSGRISRAPGPVTSAGMLTTDGHTMVYLKSDPTRATSVIARRSIISTT